MCKNTDNLLFTSDIRNEICVKKHPGYSFLLANDMRCMEDKIKSVSPENLSLLQRCWKEITGVEPKEDSDYSELYCRDESPYILVNMVHDCFLLRFVKDQVEAITRNGNETVDKMKTVKDLYRLVDVNVGDRKCYRPVDFNPNLPQSQILEFVECMEDGFSGLPELMNYFGEDETRTMGRAAIEYFQTIYQTQ